MMELGLVEPCFSEIQTNGQIFVSPQTTNIESRENTSKNKCRGVIWSFAGQVPGNNSADAHSGRVYL